MSAKIYLSAGAFLAVLAFVQDASAKCDDPLGTQVTQRVAHFKRVGDCSLLPKLMALSDRHFAYGASHCPDWHRTFSRAQVARALRPYCRDKPHTAVASTKSTESQKKQQNAGTQPAPSVSVSKSASCSDITGTGDT